jgi:hypothetical protein
VFFDGRDVPDVPHRKVLVRNIENSDLPPVPEVDPTTGTIALDPQIEGVPRPDGCDAYATFFNQLAPQCLFRTLTGSGLPPGRSSRPT